MVHGFAEVELLNLVFKFDAISLINKTVILVGY